MTNAALGSSFRDPSGFVYRRDGVLLRQVAAGYAEHYAALMESGLYERLVSDGMLVSHEEMSPALEAAPGAWRVLRPQELPFISYPYEWCFSQLQDAAMATLAIGRLALEHGMILKDASAFNVQFRGGRPLLIDSLSFERYRPGQPWIAYRQFCQHFLAPLLLVSQVDARLSGLSPRYLDGLPLELASALLPRRSWLRFGTLLHVHLHARSLRRFERRAATAAALTRPVSRNALLGLLDSLSSLVIGLTWRPEGTEWWDYTARHNYSDAGMRHKQELVGAYLRETAPRVVWDVGANVGTFSRLATATAAEVVAFDKDPAAVELHYRALRADPNGKILPLVLDLANPSPAVGWAHDERIAWIDRGPADMVLALALVHHLSIAGNVPLPRIAALFARLGRRLIVEFVPKEDSQVQRLLAHRADVFPDYTREGFEAAFSSHFRIVRRQQVADSHRWLYSMTRGR
jgi:ribosomal protein L11 methylase PrmA